MSVRRQPPVAAVAPVAPNVPPAPTSTRSRRSGPLRWFGGVLRRNPFEAAVTTVAVAYFGLALSPSSYAYALKYHFGVDDTRTWAGYPKLFRWDEWAVQTPYIQALVRCGLCTRNTTSFYHEPFRNLMSLPVLDWGFAFRPLHWGYLLLPAPWAFSLYWTLAAWLAIVGWSALLRRVGLRYWIAVAASLSIFFAPFTQAWWTGIAPLFALLPWIVFALVSRARLFWLAPVFAWLVASWIVSAAYLPGLVLLVFTGTVLALAFALRRGNLVRLATLTGAGAAGALLGVLYLAPVLKIISQTVYPGHRYAAGGGLPAAQWLSQFVPFAVTSGWASPLSINVPESVAIGSWLPLITLGLLDYRALLSRRRWAADPAATRSRSERSRPSGRSRPSERSQWSGQSGWAACLSRAWPLIVLLTGFAMLTCWQLVAPLHAIGRPFLWDRSPEQRSLMASGIVLIVAAGWALSRLPLRLTAPRLGVTVAVMVIASLAAVPLAHRPSLKPWTLLHDDLLVVLLFGVLAPLALLWRRSPRRQVIGGVGTLALLAAIPVVGVWALYNPVQDSRVIFKPVRTPITRTLDAAAAERDDHAIAANFPGATLNGLGYRSVVHALVLPQVDTFARLLPDLDPAEREVLFNRYAEIYLTDARAPKLQGPGAVLLPKRDVRRFATIPPKLGW